MSKFADLHCHPHMRSFNWFRNTKIEKHALKFHPWHIVYSNIKAKEKGKRANAYSQSDLIKLKNSNTRLVFVALYPLEQGWVKGRNEIDDKTFRQIVNSSNNSLLRFFINTNKDKIKKILIAIGNDNGKKFAFRDLMQSLFMKLPEHRIQFVQSHSYDYFSEMKEEKRFLLTRNNIKTEAEIFFPLWQKVFKNKKQFIKNHSDEFVTEGTYEIAKNTSDIQRIIETEEKIAFVFTIEGANVFNTNDNLSSIKQKINEIKLWKDTPIFFISFAHHFFNHLCGHAHSIPDIGNLVLDQSKGMNTGINTKGIETLKYLLSLDDNFEYNPDSLGRRIFVDVKHMSSLSRKDFYNEIIHKAKGKKIPIISSHSAYSGVKTLLELNTNSPFEMDEHSISTIDKPFNTWNINLSDEDIIEIFKSEGIIGLNLDQRILAIPKKQKNRTYPTNYNISYLWENIKGILRVILNYPLSDIPPKQNLVFLLGLGSDFDGYIDPMDSYPTSLEFEELRKDLIDIIYHDPGCSQFLCSLTVEQFVDNICFNNAYNFVLKNFN